MLTENLSEARIQKIKWEDILEEYKESYRRKGDDSELSFEEKIEFKEGFYENSTFISTQNFEILLDEGKGEDLYHTVAEGESPTLIASMYNLYYQELVAMNPGLADNPTVRVGQELLVGEHPYFKVVSPLSDEELEHKLIYNEAKAIEIKDNATKKQVKELCDKLPDDYPGKEELLAAVEEYEKKNAVSDEKSSVTGINAYAKKILNAIQGKWFGPWGTVAIINGNSLTVYEPNGEIYVDHTDNYNEGTTLSGTIVFEETRTGGFGIYLNCIDGGRVWIRYIEPTKYNEGALYICTTNLRFERS